MKDDLEQLLRSLRIRKIAELFDDEVKHAESADLPYEEFVARLMRAQWQANQEAALTWRINRPELRRGALVDRVLALGHGAIVGRCKASRSDGVFRSSDICIRQAAVVESRRR